VAEHAAAAVMALRPLAGSREDCGRRAGGFEEPTGGRGSFQSHAFDGTSLRNAGGQVEGGAATATSSWPGTWWTRREGFLGDWNERAFRMAAEAGVKRGRCANEYEAIEGSVTLQNGEYPGGVLKDRTRIHAPGGPDRQIARRYIDDRDLPDRRRRIGTRGLIAVQFNDHHTLCGARGGGCRREDCALEDTGKGSRAGSARAGGGVFLITRQCAGPEGGNANEWGCGAASAPDQHSYGCRAAHRTVAGAGSRAIAGRGSRGRPGRRSATGTKSSDRCCIQEFGGADRFPTRWIPGSGSNCWQVAERGAGRRWAQLFQAGPAPRPNRKGREADHQPNKRCPALRNVFHTDRWWRRSGAAASDNVQVLWAHQDSKDGKRTAFFNEAGEEILIRAVGDTVVGSLQTGDIA